MCVTTLAAMPQAAFSMGVARLPTPALLAACGITTPGHAHSHARFTFFPTVFEEKRHCSQSTEEQTIETEKATAKSYKNQIKLFACWVNLIRLNFEQPGPGFN